MLNKLDNSSPMLKQVQIFNYKNFASTKIVLQPFTVLVGPNGAGKSNFVVTKGESESHCYEVVNGTFKKEVPGIRPKIKPDHLALTVISAVEEFSPVYDFLSDNFWGKESKKLILS